MNAGLCRAATVPSVTYIDIATLVVLVLTIGVSWGTLWTRMGHVEDRLNKLDVQMEKAREELTQVRIQIEKGFSEMRYLLKQQQGR